MSKFPNKGFSAITIIIILAIMGLVVGGTYIYLKGRTSRVGVANIPIQPETNNWKVYVDSKKDFSFKYPSNWPEPQEFGMNVYLYSDDDNFRIRTSGIFEPIDPFKTWIDRQIDVINDSNMFANLTKEEVTYNNIKTVKLTYIEKASSGDILHIDGYFKKPNTDKISEIDTSIKNQKDYYLPIVDQIFSTVSFID